MTPPQKIPFYGWVLFHYIYVLYLLYPFISQWTFRVLPYPGCCKYCCNEHWGTYVFWNYGFLWLYTQEWDCCVLSIGTSAGSETGHGNMEGWVRCNREHVNELKPQWFKSGESHFPWPHLAKLVQGPLMNFLTVNTRPTSARNEAW